MTDGGQSTVRYLIPAPESPHQETKQSPNSTRIYDTMRGTGGWPQEYNGRAVINDTFRAHEGGMSETMNRELYENAVEEGDWARLTMFA